MKLLIATREKQGQRSNDFCYVPEGEIVQFGSLCDGAQTDDACGCARCMSGVQSSRATTTMRVAEVDISLEELQRQLEGAFLRDGWGEIPGNRPNSRMAERLIEAAMPFAIGDIIEYRDRKVSKRPDTQE